MEAFKAIMLLFQEILIKLTDLDMQMTRGEGYPGCGLGSGRMVAPFNGTGNDRKEVSLGGKIEGPAGSEMPIRHPKGHVRLTEGQLAENSVGRSGLVLVSSVCGVYGHQRVQDYRSRRGGRGCPGRKQSARRGGNISEPGRDR